MFYPQSCLDQYSRKFRSYCSETFAMEGIEDLHFDASLLVAGEYRRVPGLCRNPDGLFDTLCKTDEEDQKQIEQISDMDTREEMTKYNMDQIRKQCVEYGKSLGYSEHDVVNTIISAVFIQTKPLDSMKRVMWQCFGDDIVANIKANLQ